mmetsp:Transcript_17802/g.50664  ORF Transcript_17802/g.50664 Transcript_17802/m.50664 type:complete len:179 (-) Transcript_17802:522-1058(-)
MHISSQIARRVAQIITLESAAERSEAAGLPKAAQLFINVQEGCVMELPLSGTSGSLSCSEHVRRFFDLENLVTPTKLHPVQLYWQLVYILDKMRAWTSLLDRVASKEETMEATISKIHIMAKALLEPIYNLALCATPFPWELHRPHSVEEDIRIVTVAAAGVGNSVAAFRCLYCDGCL